MHSVGRVIGLVAIVIGVPVFLLGLILTYYNFLANRQLPLLELLGGCALIVFLSGIPLMFGCLMIYMNKEDKK